MRHLRALALAPLALVLVACSWLPGGWTLPTDRDALVLRVAYEGGFLAPDDHFRQTPLVSVYADGRVIQPGAQVAMYPGPLLPSLQVVRIGRASILRLLDAARQAGLATSDVSYPARGVADAPDTVITVVADGHTVTSHFGALDLEPAQQGSAAERAARQAASDFVAKASDPRALLGPDAVTDAGSYVPTAVRLLVRPGGPQAQDPALARTPLPWPLATPLATFGTRLENYPDGERCGVVEGADLALLWPVLQQATQLTGFASGGATYTVVPRPLLPDERGC